MTKRLSITLLILALLLMQTIAGLHRGSSPVDRVSDHADSQHSLHHDLFGALEGSSSCDLLDHLLQPHSASSELPCAPAVERAPQVPPTAAPSRISRFQLFGPPARGPPLQLS